MVMRAVIMISVIMAAILVLLQKRYPDNQIKFWLTSSRRESYERTNTSVFRTSRYKWLSTKYSGKHKKMIKPSQGYMLDVTSSHKNRLTGESNEYIQVLTCSK